MFILGFEKVANTAADQAKIKAIGNSKEIIKKILAARKAKMTKSTQLPKVHGK